MQSVIIYNFACISVNKIPIFVVVIVFGHIVYEIITDSEAYNAQLILRLVEENIVRRLVFEIFQNGFFQLIGYHAAAVTVFKIL